MPRRGQQSFAFGAQQGTYDMLEMNSDSSSSTDYDSDGSDPFDFGSAKFGGKVEATTNEQKGSDGEEADATQGAEEGGDDEDGESEWDEDEHPPPDLNDDALKHVASHYVAGGHGKCIDVTTLPRGSSHEIRVLHFEDGWSCIGRFARDRDEPLAILESEGATVEYVRKHTEIPVPKTYFVNPNPNHAVGAAFVLMERVEAVHLYKIWDDLSLEHKQNVMEQIAKVKLQLASLKFDSIGSLKADGSVGALNDVYTEPVPEHAFKDKYEYFYCDMPELETSTQEVKSLNIFLNSHVRATADHHEDHASLNAPFRLIHTDFDAQNMLFTHLDPTRPPKLAAIIDWDNAHIGLLYELMEYPIFIQDVEWSSKLFTQTKSCASTSSNA